MLKEIEQILARHRGKYVALSADLKLVFAHNTPKEVRRCAIAYGVSAPIVLYSPLNPKQERLPFVEP